MIHSDDTVIGILKFSDAVPFKELRSIAEEFVEDSAYEHVYIRWTSSNEIGIGFTYHYDGKTSTHDAWWRPLHNKLTAEYGHQYKGWSTSSDCYLFKGFESLE